MRRVQITMEDELERAVDEYKRADVRESDAAACRALMIRGLDVWRQERSRISRGSQEKPKSSQAAGQ